MITSVYLIKGLGGHITITITGNFFKISGNIHSTNSNSSPTTLSMNDYESYDNESNGPVRMHSGETDTDEEPAAWSPTWATQSEASQSEDRKMPDVLLKERPKHNYLMLKGVL